MRDEIIIQDNDNYSDGILELQKAMEATPVHNKGDESRIFDTNVHSAGERSEEIKREGDYGIDLVILSPKL